MVRLLFLGILGVGLMTIGCSKGADSPAAAATVSVDSNGNCTGQFVADNNAIVDSVDDFNRAVKSSFYSLSEIQQKANAIISSCDNFFKTHADNVSCRAINRSTGAETTVNTHTLKTGCDSVRSAYAPTPTAEKVSSTPAPVETFSDPAKAIKQVGDDKVVTDLDTDQVSFRVVDSSKLRDLTASDSTVAVHGKIGSITEFANVAKNGTLVACGFKVGSVGGVDTLTKGTKLGTVFITKSDSAEPRLVIMLDGNWSIFCAKNSPKPFVVGELRESLKQILDVELKLPKPKKKAQ